MKDFLKSADVVDVAARSWMKALAMFAEAQPNGYYRAGGRGTSQLVTTAAMPFLNGVISIVRAADVEEIAAFAASPHLKSVPWSVQVRGTQVDDRIVEAAADHGLRQRMELPFMVKDLEGLDLLEPVADGPKIRILAGDEGDLYRTTMAAGYGGPEEIFAIFASRSVMDHPSMRSYVVEVEGVPVATSFGVRVDDMVGVFNIAVPPQHRRFGYGRAATDAVLRDAHEGGARTAFLHASPMGFPLYEAMGFRHEENWTLLTA